MIAESATANGQTDCVTEFDLPVPALLKHGYTLGIAPSPHARLGERSSLVN